MTPEAPADAGRFKMHFGVITPTRPRNSWSFKTFRNTTLDSEDNDGPSFARREVNYRDRGSRQFPSSYGGIRRRSRSPQRSLVIKRSESPLFCSEVSISDIDKSPSPAPERKSKKATSSGIPPPRPSEDPVEHPDCTCPIGYDCAHRQANLLDCRPLVPEWEKISIRMDEEAYTRQVTRSINPAGRQITAQRLRKIFEHLQQIEAHAPTEDFFRRLEQWIHEVKSSDVDANDLQSSNILTRIATFLLPSNAQMRKNQGVSDWFEEELTYIYRKLSKGDLLSNPNRGLSRIETRDINGTVTRVRYTLDKSWQFYTDARYFGAGDLVNGQLWFSRHQLMRDGVHTATVAGIAGTAAEGAYAIIMGLHNEKNKYADIDRYDIIDYLGTALPSATATPEATNIQDVEQDTRDFNTDASFTIGTKALMQSLKTGRPVRVIRSFRAAPIVTNKPVKGYRYDGLYKVISKQPLKEERQIWSFRLRRLAGQGKLRGVRDNEPRPGNGPRKGWTRF